MQIIFQGHYIVNEWGYPHISKRLNPIEFLCLQKSLLNIDKITIRACNYNIFIYTTTLTVSMVRATKRA